MTFEKLNELIKKHNIPNNVTLLSDSGWECDETEMNGVFYNEEKNHIVFTQFTKDGKYYDKVNYKELR